MARLQRNTAPVEKAHRPARRVVQRTPNKLGVQKVYDPIRFPQAAKVLCKEHGFTRTQLAEVFGVTRSVIAQWIGKHPEFAVAIQEGMDHFDTQRVERTLLQTALGFDYEEKTVSLMYDKFGQLHENVSTTTKKALPNVKAMTFWLVNRQKDRWKQESTINANVTGTTEHTNRTVKITADLSKMDVNQLKSLRDMISMHNTDAVDSVEHHELDMIPLMQQAQTIADAELINI